MLHCVLAGVLAVLFSGARSSSVEELDFGTCQSEFLQQPPDQLQCNPYINAELRLDCIVSIPATGPLAGRLSVEWFHNTMLFDTPQVTTGNQLTISRLDSAQENITVREQMMPASSNSLQKRVRSRLEVRRLDEHDIGQYWCGIRIDSSEWVLLSDPLLLEHPGEYLGLEPCSTTVAQSKRERKCATWSFEAQTTPPPPLTFTTSPSVPVPGPSSIPEDTTTEVDKTQPPETTTNQVSSSASTENTFQPTSEVAVERDETTTSELPEEGIGLLMWVAIGVLGTFGAVILALVAVMISMCIKYRKVVRGMRKQNAAEEKSPRVIVQSPSTTATATDYLVPISTTERGQQHQVFQVHQPSRTAAGGGDNPVYMAELRQEFTSFWLERQRQSPRTDLEHSYESMAHDYEDIFLESLNSVTGQRHPVLMKANEAYTIPRSLNFNIDPNMLPLY